MSSFADLFGGSFNAEELAAKAISYDPIPSGWYTVQLETCDEKPTKSGGSMLVARFSVLDGPFANRKVFHNFNTNNANQQAVDIAMRELGQLCVATGKRNAQSADELIGSVCQIKVSLGKDNQGGDRNDVKGYRACNGSVATPAKATIPASTPVQQAPAPLVKTNKPMPWDK